MKNKYIVKILKTHTINIKMISVDIMSNNTIGGYDVPMERELGSRYHFKTLKRAKEFMAAGNAECAGAYVLSTI